MARGKKFNISILIYSNHVPGAWYDFLEHKIGTIIIHHSCERFIRNLPRLAELLNENQKYTVWLVNEMQPGAPILDVEQNQERGLPRLAPRLSLQKLFPHGGAILITPTFVLTDPKGTLDLLLWFSRTLADIYSWIIVGCHNFVEYLFELCEEDIKAREKLRGKNLDPNRNIVEENSLGISEEFIEMRLQAATLAEALRIKAPSGLIEESSRIIEAPSTLDENDEQSLVNWFGAWSLLRADRHRKFYVVGTKAGPNDVWNRQLASRIIQMPKFGRREVEDPDIAEAMESHSRLEGILNDGLNVELRSEPIPAPQRLPQGVPELPLTAASIQQPPDNMSQLLTEPFANASTDSAIFASDKAWELADKLKILNERYKGFSWWHLYNRPVSWSGDEMQRHFEAGIIHQDLNYERFYDWWNHGWRFTPKPPNNTYIGLFYTIDSMEPWEPAHSPRGVMPPRHPWIAVYRIQRPHDMRYYHKHKFCDLLIWDARARLRFPGPGMVAPTLAALPDMQKKLYAWVSERTGIKNTGSTLKKLYYGGFTWPKTESNSTHPLDITIAALENIIRDPKAFLPPEHNWLIERGWKLIDTSKTSLSTPITHLTAPQPTQASPPRSHLIAAGMSLDSVKPPYTPEELRDPNVKYVCHPPRGKENGPVRSSSCHSLLQKVRMVQKLKPESKKIIHEYAPTMSWYNQQVKEGRGFAHILLLDWGEFNKSFIMRPSKNLSDESSSGLNGSTGSGKQDMR